MVGTKAGGMKASKTNLKKHGADFYKRIGSKGGQNGHTGGFGSEAIGKDGLTGPERAKKWGAVGGRRSVRTRAPRKEKEYIWRPGDELFSR